MIGPYESKEELLSCMLYWNRRALKAETELKDTLDYNEELVDMVLEERKAKEYYKQQFLDKQKELEYVLG